MNNSEDRFPLMRFELAELETFLVVAREGSFSMAAKRLHVSQPSVTSRIQRLESTLRVKLLTRTTRRVEPTPDGVMLRDAAEEALKGLREVLRHFQETSEIERNRVVVASTPMVAATVMPSIIHSYCLRYPDVQVMLRDLPYEQVIKSVSDGHADIGVTAADTPQDNLNFELLAEEEMLLVVPADHSLSGAESVSLDMITAYPLMFLERYSHLRDRLAQEYERLGVPFRPGITSTLPTLLGMIDAGNCITFLPRSMAQSSTNRSRTTLRVRDFHASRRYGSVVARKGNLNAAARSFHRHLHTEFERILRQDGSGRARAGD